MSDKAHQDAAVRQAGLEALQSLHDAGEPLSEPLVAWVRQLRREAIRARMEVQLLILESMEARHGK